MRIRDIAALALVPVGFVLILAMMSLDIIDDRLARKRLNNERDQNAAT